METVEVVIKIPKQVYEHVNVWKDLVYDDYIAMVGNAILNCTVLPKGHTDLIDRQALIHSIEQKAKRLSNLDTINGLCGAVALIYDAEVIIKADEDGDADG